MAGEICCVCDTPIEGSVQALGSRTFCERHYVSLTRDRRGLWVTTAASIIALLLFVLAMSALAPGLNASLTGTMRDVVGVIMAVVPAALWLTVFYLQDRVEPEPKHNILGVFLLGALLASAIGQPLITGFFNVNDWAGDNLLLRLVAGIFIVGALQEYLKYAAVRHTVFGSPEFDERIDGIIYGAAAGLGYATMVNMTYVIGTDGLDLGVGAIRIVVATLAHASFAGVTGYFLGRAKFENMGPFWLPGGILLAAVLNGVVTVGLGAISRTGLQATPFNGVALAAVVAAITFGLLFATMRRANQAVLVRSTTPV